MSKFDTALETVKQLESQAVDDVLEYYGGIKATAQALGVTPGSLRSAKRKGVLGRYVALCVAQDPVSPFALEDLRSDYQAIAQHDTLKRPGPGVRAA